MNAKRSPGPSELGILVREGCRLAPFGPSGTFAHPICTLVRMDTFIVFAVILCGVTYVIRRLSPGTNGFAPPRSAPNGVCGAIGCHNAAGKSGRCRRHR